MPAPISPAPVTQYRPDVLPPYISNGVMGIRLASLPHLPGTTMVSGFAGLDPNDGVEGFARAPYALATDIRLDGVWASRASGQIQFRQQRYDFSTGEVATAWTFRVGDATARVETVAFCSRTVPALAVCRTSVRVNRPADVALAAGVDPTAVIARLLVDAFIR